MSFAGLWTFLAFLALAVVSIWREAPLYYPHFQLRQGETGIGVPKAAAIIPFDDILVVDPNELGANKGRPTATPVPLRRETTDKGFHFVCELGAETNHLGQLDGKALAKDLAQDLVDAGLFDRVSLLDGPAQLHDQTVLITGRVTEAQLRILQDGSREYEVAYEVYAAGTSPEQREQKPFWMRTLLRKARSEGAPAAYEISALVRALNAEAVSALGEFLRQQPSDDEPTQPSDEAPALPQSSWNTPSYPLFAGRVAP
jgi:hypothetical protein